MIGDCHIHMILDGVYYRAAIDAQRERVDEALLQIYNKRTKYPLSFSPLFKSRYGGDYEEAEQNPVTESIDEDQLTDIDEQSDQLSIDALIDQEPDTQE